MTAVSNFRVGGRFGGSSIGTEVFEATRYRSLAILLRRTTFRSSDLGLFRDFDFVESIDFGALNDQRAESAKNLVLCNVRRCSRRNSNRVGHLRRVF